MDTKLKADISEHAVIAKLLKLGFKVLKPVGDWLPYDLALDLGGKLLRGRYSKEDFEHKIGMCTQFTKRHQEPPLTARRSCRRHTCGLVP